MIFETFVRGQIAVVLKDIQLRFSEVIQTAAQDHADMDSEGPVHSAALGAQEHSSVDAGPSGTFSQAVCADLVPRKLLKARESR